jgi:hypothetical protein
MAVSVSDLRIGRHSNSAAEGRSRSDSAGAGRGFRASRESGGSREGCWVGGADLWLEC